MAAEDTKGKKRKSAQDAAPKAKKPRKSDDVAATTKPAKAAKAAPVATVTKTVTKTTRGKAARKEAADFMSEDEAAAEPCRGDGPPADTNGDAPEPAAPAPEVSKPKKQSKKAKAVEAEEAPVVDAPKEKTKPAKKGKKEKAEPAPVVEEVATKEVVVEAPAKKTKKAKGGKKVEEEPVEEVVEEVVEGDIPEDDQTAALLAGFESSDDSDDPENDLNFDDDAPVPKLNKKQRTALEKATQGARSNEPGVVYVGRVPRGFFEPQMKKYFSQFGRVTRLRLSRNKKTGASKHYDLRRVPVHRSRRHRCDELWTRTCSSAISSSAELIPADQVNENLFKGAGERFKVDPRNKKAGLQMERGVERAQWEKRVEHENKRRTGRSKALKEEFGYEFNAPALKGVDAVPKHLTNGDAPQLTEAPVEETPVKGKKGKKAAKVDVEQQPIAIEADLQAEIAANVGAPTPEKKATKGRKRKSDVAAETVAGAEEPVVAEVTVKSKKAKKETNPAVVADETPEKKRKAKVEQDVAKPKKAKKAKA
ncbi:hypothetical protein SNOG_05437 [Parastagonospora nodorum SN15]|uniref:RRM domain-containing protein n=1 Tax=Phaeosphaeria nodorum (strain SN15 / ATCC MYA-4574 / FGSC 10173) TaxID=321614 RepID=Q0US27_PHANO|nr:hypothetical protein SNOG_05437 [Parastagonospora nodorum SN15]EAT87828.2 hypothetical protein SNOG_05437 [Parastagonospora nodorum SN15]